MSTPREMHLGPKYETVRLRAVLIPFPVNFDIPEAVREAMPIGQLHRLMGVRLVRMYCIPHPGDTIEFRGHLWKVLGLHHEVRPTGSKMIDKLPIALTEYIGPMETTHEI